MEALHGQQPCGNHILERIFVAVRWYGTPADHPEPHDPTIATARFDTYEAANAFAHRLRRLIRHAQALFATSSASRISDGDLRRELIAAGFSGGQEERLTETVNSYANFVASLRR